MPWKSSNIALSIILCFYLGNRVIASPSDTIRAVFEHEIHQVYNSDADEFTRLSLSFRLIETCRAFQAAVLYHRHEGKYNTNEYKSLARSLARAARTNPLDQLFYPGTHLPSPWKEDKLMGLGIYPLAELRDHHLKSHQSILSYFIGYNSLYVVHIGKENARITVSSILIDELVDLVEKFHNGLFEYHTPRVFPKLKSYQECCEDLVSASYSLFQLLIPEGVNTGIELMIVPDHVVISIPFDLLIQTPADSARCRQYSKHDYLACCKNTRYHWSASGFIRQIRNSTRPFPAFTITEDYQVADRESYSDFNEYRLRSHFKIHSSDNISESFHHHFFSTMLKHKKLFDEYMNRNSSIVLNHAHVKIRDDSLDQGGIIHLHNGEFDRNEYPGDKNWKAGTVIFSQMEQSAQRRNGDGYLLFFSGLERARGSASSVQPLDYQWPIPSHEHMTLCLRE